jgi:SAM-dependent methyltransferase
MMDNLYKTKLPVMTNRLADSVNDSSNVRVGTIELALSEYNYVYNRTFDESLLNYDGQYQNEQGYSPIFQKHIDDVLEIVLPHVQGKEVIEIGCGKGSFLEKLRKHGVSITGYDSSYTGDKSYIVKTHIDQSSTLSCDIIILRHVLEHINNPTKFLSDLSKSVTRECLVYIEVPDIEWTLKNEIFYDIAYEHCNYFRLSSFNSIFSDVLETGSFFKGQYIYAVAPLSLKLQKAGDLSISFDCLVDKKQRLREKLKNNKVIIWSAAGKGGHFAYEFTDLDVDFAVDINPQKQNKYIYGTNIRVVSPEEAKTRYDNHLVVIMNAIYAHEIIDLFGSEKRYFIADDE